MTTVEKNKETIERLYRDCLNKKDIKSAAQLVDEAYTGPKGAGVAAFTTPLEDLLRAFPDAGWEITVLAAEGDRVTVKQKFHGTHRDTFQGIPPTGKAVITEGIAVYEMSNGKIKASELLTDRLGFLQQLGVIPADPRVLIADKYRKHGVSFIDKFFIPAAAKEQFMERMEVNRRFIRQLPGFIGDAAYTDTDEQGNLKCVTVARWESREALEKARERVQAEYRQEGFDPAEMMKKLDIVADRGIYSELDPE